MLKKMALLFLVLLTVFFLWAQNIPADFEFEIVEGRSVTITGYNGNATVLNIPAQIQGLPVTTIANYAFAYKRSLISINIPFSVTSIDTNPFFVCDNLINITVDNQNPSFASIDGVLFDKNIRILVRYPPAKAAENYTLPSSVISVGFGAFGGCISLASVTLSRRTAVAYGALPETARIIYSD